MSARTLRRVAVPSLPSWEHLRRRLIVLGIVLIALAAAYVFWFRDSSFVEVRSVEVVGADADPAAVAALTSAGSGQSTLDLDVGTLQAAVANNPEVASIDANASFPHGLRIVVELRQPAAYLSADGGSIVAIDGTVLETGAERPAGLPMIEARADGASGHLEGPALTLAAILGAAPGPLATQVDASRVDPEYGPIVALNGGIELRFGDEVKVSQKWAAASRILADPSFTGANYLDLSDPSRPVAG